MRKRFPIVPQHPERVCWGCDRYCAADKLLCGNDTERTQHPSELFGEDWLAFGLDALPPSVARAAVDESSLSTPLVTPTPVV